MAIKVYYSKATRETGFYGVTRHNPESALAREVMAAVMNPANYEHVATFDDSARDCDDIWEAMEAEVSPIPRMLMKRSMMVGDVLVSDTGKVTVVASCGFDDLDVDASKYETRDVPVFNAKTKGRVS